jgi:hypothetical protein
MSDGRVVALSSATAWDVDQSLVFLNPNGSLDTTVNPDLSSISNMSVHAAGKVLINLGASDKQGDMIIIDGQLYAIITTNQNTIWETVVIRLNI